MNSRRILSRSAASLCAVLVSQIAANAQTWTNTAGGSWNTTTNWSGGVVANGTDVTADFSTLNITANATVTLDGARTIGGLKFGDVTTSSNDWILNVGSGGPLTLDVTTGPAPITVLNARTTTISVPLAGTDGISMNSATTGTAAGTLILSGANTFTGGVTINGGTLQLNNANAAGGSANVITIAPSVNSSIQNKLVINAGVTIANDIVIQGGAQPLTGRGAIEGAGTGRATINGAITINGNTAAGGHFFTSNTVGNELVLNGPITSSVEVVQRGGRVIYAGGGTGYTSLGTNDTTLVGATNGISTAATVRIAVSQASTLDLNGFDQSLAGLIFGGGGNFNSTVAVGSRTLTLTGPVTTQNNAVYNITGTGTVSFGNTAGTLIVNDGTQLNDLIVAPTISGTAGFVKQGSGTLILNGNVTNTGPTTISSGALGGNTTFSGALIIGDTAILQPGTATSAGSITASSLKFDTGFSFLNMNVGAAGDLVTANNLTTAGTALINAYQLGGILPNGEYNLIKYSGTSPGLTGFQLNPVGHAVASLIDTGSAIALKITGNDRVIWTGATSIGWDTFSQNFKLQSNNAPATYIDSDEVIFPDAPVTSDVDISSPLTPSNVTFNNASGTTYTISGFAGIIGATGLTKNNTGTTILRTQNSYAGPTNVNGGTLELDYDATGGLVLTATSGINLAAGTTLRLTRDDGNISLDRPISGSGTIIIDPHTVGGAAVREVSITGNNTGFTGVWKLSPTGGGAAAGTSFRTNVQMTPTTLGAGSVEVGDGAQLWITGNQTYNNPIKITGTGYGETAGGTPVGLGPDTNGVLVGTGTPLFNYGGIGAIRADNGSTIAGPITVIGNSKIMSFGGTATVSGTISSTSPADTLVFGGGTSTTANAASTIIILTGANTYGKTLLNGGSGTATSTQTLQIGANGASGTLGTGDVVLYGNSATTAFLRFSRSDGYTLGAGQKITSAAGVTADLARTSVGVNTTGSGLTLNGNTIDLSDGATGGNLHVAGNSGANGVNGARLNLNGASVVDVGNLYVGDQGNFAGFVNVNDTSAVTVLNQVRIGHYPTETSNLNVNGGSFTVTSAAPAAFPFATTGTTEQAGGIYLGVDGTGNLTQTGGTVSTNFVVLDNRGETSVAANTPTGVDTYTLSGGTLILRNAYGIISRYQTTQFNLNGGTIQAAAATNPNLDSNRITVSATSTLDTNGTNTFTLYGPLSGTGTLNLIGLGTLRTQDGTGATLTAAGGGMFGGSLGTASINVAGTSTLQANRTGVDVWSGSLSGAGSFVKQNTGTLFMNGNSSGFTGSATVSAGRLEMPNNFGAALVTVNENAAIGGEPTLAALTLGPAGGALTQTVFFNPNTPGALTAANLTANGTTLVDFASSPTGAGPYTVLNYTAKTGPGTFALANATSYRSATVNDTGTGTVSVNVTTKALTWTGAASGVWDVKNASNWTDGSIPETFFAGDTVTFAEGGANPTITIGSLVTPFKTAVTSDGTNYTFTSSGGGLGGPGGLEKTGASTLTLSGANSYAGPTSLNGGNLAISSAASLGNATPSNTISFNGGKLTTSAAMDLGVTRAIDVGAGGGTFSSSGTAALTMTVSGPIRGSGTLNFTSGATAAPTYVLSGNNSGFSGSINIDSAGASSGATQVRFSNGLAPIGGTVNLAQATVTGAATGLDLVNVSVPAAVGLVMNTATAGTSSFRSQLTNTSGSSVWNGPITLNGDNIAQFSTVGTMALNGDISAGLSGFTGTMFLRGSGQGVVNGKITMPGATLAKTDAATWTMNSTGNSWTLTSVVSSGSLKLGVDNALPITASLNIGQPSDANASTLDLNGFNQEVASISYTPGTGNSSRGVTNTSTTPSIFTVNNATDIGYGASSGVTGGIIAGNLSLVKTGSGVLTLAGNNTFTGNVTINGGTLVAAGSAATTLGSPTTAGRSITANAGTNLSFATNNVFGNGVNNNNLPSITLNGSILNAVRYNVVGNLNLNGATITQTSTDSGGYEGLQFRGNVSVTGTTASTITSTNGKATHLGPNTQFDVADVTGSAAADLFIDAPLRDQSADFGSAPGNFTKVNIGTLELAGSSTFTGAGTINAGTLVVSGSIGGSLNVNAGGTLAGIGTTGLVNVVGGTLTPGNGVGTLSTGALSLDSAASIRLELAQSGVLGGVNDLLSVAGNLTLDGTLLVSQLAGFSVGTYPVITYTGALTNSGLDLETAFLAAYPGSRIDTATPGQISLVVVPEPTALAALLVTSRAMLGLRRLRRRSAGAK